MPCKGKVGNLAGAMGAAGGGPTDITPVIVAICQELVLTRDQLMLYKERFLDNVKRGLGKDTNPTAIVKCFPTYVQDLPDGTEVGKFLALDLGGSHFRVLLVTLDGPICNMQSRLYSIPNEIIVGSGIDLFNFIAASLADFAEDQDVCDQLLSLGFCFGFPLIQKGLTKGILDKWTKGFSCSGVVGNDVVIMLEEAIARSGDVQIDVCAVLNDTTGTLMSCAWVNPDCKIGLIIGTTTNGCYLEDQANAELFDEPDKGSGKVIINLEWGTFGDDGALDFCRTAYDIDVDQRSPNPGRELYEKMISGMYMGELVRLAAVRLTKEGLMFGGKGSDTFFAADSFETRYISEIESDPKGVYTQAKTICDKLDLGHASKNDLATLRFLCECISARAAHLISAALSVLMEKIGSGQKIVVGIDGIVYKSHPHVHNLMTNKIRELLADPSIEYELMVSEDGSGRGAALVAAAAAKNKDAAK